VQVRVGALAPVPAEQARDEVGEQAARE